MSKHTDYDFCGWATRNDVLCSDGRTIRKGAFSHQDGQKVPLIWAHQHDSPEAVLGHGYLEDRPEGVYFYGYLNDTPMGVYSKQCIEHGDLTSLSIWANQLQQQGGAVLHGDIKEVSLVLAGANKKAYIDYPFVAHGDDIQESVDEAYIWTGDEYGLKLAHADKDDDEAEEKMSEPEKKKTEESEDASAADILATLNDDQKVAVSILIAALKKKMQGEKSDDDEEDEDDLKHSDVDSDDSDEDDLKHSDVDSDDSDEDNEINHSDMEEDTMQYNAFDQQASAPGYVLSHADEAAILADARACGSFRKALNKFADENELAHDGLAPVSGFPAYPANGETTAAIDTLFPDFHNVRPGAPEVVTNDLGWVKAVLGKVTKSPYGKLHTRQVDIRDIAALRAKGYLKGKEKALAGAYNVAIRETSSQTVYIKSALNQDDIDDITEFDYVDFQYQIDRAQLEYELARAVLIGDGRDAADPDKINPERIRPIWTDDSLFTIRKVVKPAANSNGTNTAANFGAGYLYAQAVEEALLDAKIDYRGSNSLDMFCAQRFYNKLLLAKDLNGRRIYTNKNELDAMLDVNNVYPVHEFDNLTRTENGKTYRLLAILGNLRDYTMGSTKGGQIVHRTQFDIDFNQQKSLLETRTCGTPTRIYSFIVLEEEVNP